MEFHSGVLFLDYSGLERFKENHSFKTKKNGLACDLHIKENHKHDMHISGKNG
jgi:hypothetical protein